MIKGMQIHEINGKKYELQEKELILVKPDDQHRVYTPKGSNTALYNFEIRESFFQQLVNSIYVSSYDMLLAQANICIKCDEILFQQLRNALSSINNIREEDYKNKQRILQILMAKMICEMMSEKAVVQNYDSIIDEIFAYMKAPENMNSSLEDLARHFGYCCEHILRLFKRNDLDKPSKEWRTIKMQYASNLLMSYNFSLPEIAEQIGIVNVNYFSKIFKETFGVSPSQYRKLYAEKRG